MYKAMLGFILQGYVNRIGVHTQNSSFLEVLELSIVKFKRPI